MVGISPEICFAIRQARRAAKLSQQEIAAEVNCKQPALSMFEQGDPTKLNDEVVEKLAKKFGIDLHAPKGTKSDGTNAAVLSRPLTATHPQAHTGFCPNPNCPTNQRYEVDARVLLLPNRTEADPVGGKFCALCGESLVRKCPNCGSAVHQGAICSVCGDPYIALT